MAIMTVDGPVAPEQCGLALPHEHLFIDLRHQSPSAASRAVTPGDSDLLRRDPYALSDNLRLVDPELTAAELAPLRRWGCDLVADCTVPGIGRDLAALRNVGRRVGMHIVAGCGYYTADTHPPGLGRCSPEAIGERLAGELAHGEPGTGIRPGLIGEIGTSAPIAPSERNALRGAGRAHRLTGAAIQVHIYPWSTHGEEAARLLLALDCDPEKIVICHADVWPDRAYIRRLLALGVWVEFDNLGKEFTPDTAAGGFADGAFAGDATRVELLAELIDEGFGRQLLLTNDICLKNMLLAYGGNGYGHVFAHILPALERRGVDAAYARDVLCRDNPLRLLDTPFFDPPAEAFGARRFSGRELAELPHGE